MSSQAATRHKATLLFGILLLLFIQTLTLCFDSIYKIALTKLSMGMESLGVLFLLSPLLVLLLPKGTQRKVLWGSIILFLASRAVVPLASAVPGVVVAGLGVGAFLVALCLILSRPFRSLQGDAGVALGLAVMLSIALRAWGATYDFTLGASGAWLGWVLIGIVVWQLWSLRSATDEPWSERDGPLPMNLGNIQHPTSNAQHPRMAQTRGFGCWMLGSWGDAFGPVLSLFANLTMVYLVLSSPGVVEAWMGFDNTAGVVLLIAALGCALIMMLERGRIPFGLTRGLLVMWNLAFSIALVGGILALRVHFPATPEAPPVIVRPENLTARLLLNLMFLLSPVVLFNVQAACRSLKETVNARALALPVFLGVALLTLTTTVSIFTNTWGYVGNVSAVFRNQFHLPYAVLAGMMTATLFLPGWRAAFAETERLPRSTALASLAGTLALIAAAGTWHYRPVASKVMPDTNRLTILTYNLQQGAALNGDRNWENQLALIRAIDADVIGLQESDTPRASNGNVSAAKYFGAKLGYHVCYGPNTVSGTYGTAILSRFPLHNPRSIFTFSDEDEGGTALAELDVQGKRIAFLNSHPSGKIPRRCHALELVRQAAAYEYVIAVGDYNSSPQEQAYRIIAGQLKDTWLEKYPDGVGLLHGRLRPRGKASAWHDSSSGQVSDSGETIAMPDRIDHIFVSKPFHVLEDYFLPAPDSQTDHPAHWSVVTFPITVPGTSAVAVAPPGLTTNSVERSAGAESLAPVPVPEPSEKAVHFYRSGIVWWLVGEGWSWLVPALILLTGFSGWLGRLTKRIGRWEVCATFVFVLLYLLICYALSFPLSYFRGFVRLHEYGLSNQTFTRWLDHSIKAMLVNVLIFGTTFAVLRQLMRWSPRRWWVYCSLFVGAGVFFMAFAYPIWIDPLFNRFGPMKDKQLESDIVALAQRAGIEGARIYEVDKSADTKAVNAYVNGLGSTKRIVLWDTIIAKLDRDELRFIMAHEMGHYMLRHMLILCLLSALAFAGGLWLVDRIGNRIIARLGNRLGFQNLSDLGAIPLLLLFLTVLSFLLAPLSNLVTRHTEHEADRFALEITRNNRASALAFVKLQRENLSVPRPAFLDKLWRGTHPSLGDRIDFANTYHPWITGEAGKYDHLFKRN